MIRYVLDTDIVSLLQHGDRIVEAHVASHKSDETATTIITVEEQLSAWYTLLRQAKNSAALVPVYQRMCDTVRFLSALPLATFSETASETYETLREQHRRIGRMDLRIAAIALTLPATLVTRNLADFQPIAGLTVEDWSRP